MNFIKLKLYIINIIIVLMIVGCETQQFVKTADREEVTILWLKEHRSWQAVRANCDNDKALACTDGKYLYMPEPLDAEDHEQMRILGHEVLHYFWDAPGGNWHEDKR